MQIERRVSWRRRAMSVAAAGALALSGALVATQSSQAGPNAESVLPALAPVARDAAASAIPASGTFAPVVKEAAPAVVSITAEKIVRASEQRMPFPFGPQQAPRDRRSSGAGSGVIVAAEGFVVTNHHVIDGAEDVDVHLADGRSFEAEIVGSDAKTDVAVLRIDGEDLPVLPFGNSDAVEVGDIALAIGNPFGIGQTVTMGIVGATGRGGLGIEDYEDFIQTDAAINPGNSGGALINSRGELIGINTAILSRSGGNNGVGFAVPINMAHHISKQLLESGKVSRGYLGVGIQDGTPALAKALGAPDGVRGALVRGVEPGGPAAEAGLAQGDLITAVDGDSVADARELRLRVGAARPGETVHVDVIRDGETKQLAVDLAEFPGEDAPRRRAARDRELLNGVSVQELSPGIAEQLDVRPGTEGVVVSDVAPASAAFKAGLRRGDVVVEVNRAEVSNVTEFAGAVEQSGDTVLLLVLRQGNTVFVAVETE